MRRPLQMPIKGFKAGKKELHVAMYIHKSTEWATQWREKWGKILKWKNNALIWSLVSSYRSRFIAVNLYFRTKHINDFSARICESTLTFSHSQLKSSSAKIWIISNWSWTSAYLLQIEKLGLPENRNIKFEK